MHMRNVLFYVGRLAHPIYRECIHAAPAGFRYVPGHPDLVDEAAPKRDVAAHGTFQQWARRRITRAAVSATTRAGVIRKRRIEVPEGIDLVHSGQILLRDSSVPYVVDCEDGHVFAFYQRGALERPWARRALIETLTADDCCAVLPWTDAARRGFLNALGDDRDRIAARTHCVLPAVRPRADAPRHRSNGALRLLFVGTTFFGKGGPETIAALERVRSTHDVELDLVTFLPPTWRARVEREDAVRLHEGITPTEVQRLLKRADVFIFPAHVDTLGWVVFEAQAAAVPVLSSTHFSQPELVQDGVSGLLFPCENSLYDERGLHRFPWFNPTSYPAAFLDALAHPSDAYIDGIASRIARLAEDRDLCERLSAGALDRVRRGPLSVVARQQRLSAIYQRVRAR